jgi:SHS2 domain-containing protein
MKDNLIGFYEHSTGQSVVREMTETEQNERDLQIAHIKVMEKQQTDQQEAKAEAKAALLQRLGITEEEAKLLLS